MGTVGFGLLVGLVMSITSACQIDQDVWYRGGASQADYERAAYECERDTRMAAATFGSGLAGAANAEAFTARCMNSKGFYRARASQVNPAPRLFNTSSPPTPLRDSNGAVYAGTDYVMCKFPDTDAVRFTAETCSQGRGTIIGPAPK